MFLAKYKSLGCYYSKLEDYGSLVNDPEIMMCIIASSGFEMCPEFEKYVNDRDFMLGVCKVNGYAIRYASKELRKDKELALVSIRYSNRAFSCCDELLRRAMLLC